MPTTQTPTSLQGFFLASPDGDLWITRWQPPTPARASVLVVPAFAEEMNKCRTMQAMLGRSLAQLGIQTIAVDLFGTGDSAGEFRDARLAHWQDNLNRVADWAAASGAPVAGLLGMRFGAALALNLATMRQQALRLALWQPIVSGDLLIKQFLRLRVAGGLLAGGGSETVVSLSADLAAGTTLEVAGYELSADLAQDLQTMELRACTPPDGTAIAWFEVRAGDALSKVGSDSLRDWAAAGLETQSGVLAGDTFWNTVELTSCPALVERTAEFFAAAAPRPEPDRLRADDP
ncbi:MAG: hydrolase 2, exosortase A system-associated [Gammaproteobacteria bacterium]